ncbi:MAG: response regulator [Promethearchaeota archaeon]|nr:MAG: response regulator [Candidatus Lokiarchaeota archaeon]
MSDESISVLLIEDSEADTKIIIKYLEKEKDYNYKVKTAKRLSEGIETLKKNTIDIVLLDLNLPDSKKAKTLSRLSDFSKIIPTIVLTGIDDKEFALESLQKGAQDYLVKDEINSSVLTRSILYAIERYKMEHKDRKKAQILQIDEKDKEILNILQENYRISYQELSRRIGLAASTIHNRVQNLINAEVIKKFDTLIDPIKVGFETIAIIGLSVEPLKMENVAQKLSAFNNVQLVATTTGNHDMVARIIAKNEKELWKFINEKIKVIDGIKTDMDVSSFIEIYKMTHKILFDV